MKGSQQRQKVISINLNGTNYTVRVKYDENNKYEYNLADMCLLAGYRNSKQALGKLLKYDYIGSPDKWLQSGYIPDFLVRDFLNIAPCYYSSKLLQLFENYIFQNI